MVISPTCRITLSHNFAILPSTELGMTLNCRYITDVLSPAFYLTKLLQFLVVSRVFLKYLDSLLYTFVQIISQFSKREISEQSCPLKARRCLEFVESSFWLRNSFFYQLFVVGDLAKAIDHHEIDGNHGRLANQFSGELIKNA